MTCPACLTPMTPYDLGWATCPSCALFAANASWLEGRTAARLSRLRDPREPQPSDDRLIAS